MKTLINRILSPTPGWFVRIIKLAMTLAAAGGAILTAPSVIPGFHLSSFLNNLCQALVVAGLAAAAVAKTAKEDKPDNAEVTQQNGSPSGTSSLPVSPENKALIQSVFEETLLRVISVTPMATLLCLCLLLTGCSRKVALQKTYTHSVVDSEAHSIDTSKHSLTNTSTTVDYFGDTAQGNIYLQPDTSAVATPLFDSISAGGIKLKLALVPAGTGYKAIYYVAAKPVETVNTNTKAVTDDEGKSATVDLQKQVDSASKIKDVTAPEFSFGKMAAAIVIVICLLIGYYLLKPYLQIAFGWFIALFKKKEAKP